MTNWFRNLRQTARKRAKKAGSGDDDYDDFNPYSASVSRSGTPSLRSSSSPTDDMDLDANYDDDEMHGHSDLGSEDEYQEAVTPSPEQSPSPPPTSAPSRIPMSRLGFTINPATYAELEKTTAIQFSGIKVEDALLLLSFHQHIVH